MDRLGLVWSLGLVSELELVLVFVLVLLGLALSLLVGKHEKTCQVALFPLFIMIVLMQISEDEVWGGACPSPVKN